MNYINIELTAPEKPEVFAIAEAVKRSRNEVLGACVRFWAWLDLHCDDEETDMKPESVDKLVELKGFAKAFAECGWGFINAKGRLEILYPQKFLANSSKARERRARRATIAREAKRKKGGEQ